MKKIILLLSCIGLLSGCVTMVSGDYGGRVSYIIPTAASKRPRPVHYVRAIPAPPVKHPPRPIHRSTVPRPMMRYY